MEMESGGPESELLSCGLPGAGMAFISARDADSMLSVPSARPGPSHTVYLLSRA